MDARSEFTSVLDGSLPPPPAAPGLDFLPRMIPPPRSPSASPSVGFSLSSPFCSISSFASSRLRTRRPWFCPPASDSIERVSTASPVLSTISIVDSSSCAPSPSRMTPAATDGAASCAPGLPTLTSLLLIFGGGRRADLGRTRFEDCSSAAATSSSRGFIGADVICCRPCSAAASASGCADGAGSAENGSEAGGGGGGGARDSRDSGCGASASTCDTATDESGTVVAAW
mmetsp:Transcript_43508/g.114350  ORF Transcript_43508/g.114350 Transcript_43508/m.114350 type:complete len:229 (+) Transcript_43508:917-1603(+)